MKRRTKKLIFADYGDAIKCIHRGIKVKRSTYKDGSIPTKPVVPVDETKLEREVLTDCLVWLIMHGVFCQRHDSGSFQNDRGQWGTYGIKNSGDIHGMLKNNWGKHFEIETKRGSGGRQSKGQQNRMRDVRENDSLYFVVHGVEELEHYMGEWV